jgi:hypothetical protein
MCSLALVVAGGIYLASNFPRHFSLAPAVGLLAASSAILVVNVVLLSRIEGFAWRRFRTVTGWALLAYVVIAGMIEYVFVLDHTRGTVLIVTTLMLGVFGLNPPLILGFTVARYERTDTPPSSVGPTTPVHGVTG